jgi:transposase
VERVVTKHGVSERLACRVLDQHRSTQRKIPKPRDDEATLTADIIALAIQYGRYGYRRITKMLCAAGWTVSFKRVERIWRREGLKVPAKQPKRGRLWLNDGCYGPYTTVYNRFNRWSRRGIWKLIFDALASKSRDSLYLIDSTIVKAHRAASGAKGGSKNRRSASVAADARQKSMPSSIVPLSDVSARDLAWRSSP